MARYTVQPQKVEETQRAIAEFVETIKVAEPGTFYEAYQEADSPSFVHLMCFEDEEAEDAHRKSAHTGKFVSILYPICEQEPVFTELSLFRSSEL